MRPTVLLVSLAVFASTPAAYCETSGTYTYNSAYPISLKSHTTASLVAAGLMGAQGYAAYLAPSGWDRTFADQCTAMTRNWRGFTDPGMKTVWPGDCDPLGMAYALDGVAGTGHGWGVAVFGKWDQKPALEKIITALQRYNSPAVIPLYGDSNHWVAVQQMIVTYTIDDFEISSTFIYDASPSPDSFSKRPTAKPDGRYELKETEMLRAVYSLLDVAGDTAYDRKHVVMFDPPPGASILPEPELTRRSLRKRSAPGLALSGGLDAATAKRRLWEALLQAGTDEEELRIWQVQGSAGEALLVRGHYPSGQERNYYLIPIYDRTTPAFLLASVELSAEDGSVLAIRRLSAPSSWAYKTLSLEQAAQGAATLLAADEWLAGGELTWNSAASHHPLRAPYFPFYQFDIRDQAGGLRGHALVAHHNAAILTRMEPNYRARLANRSAE